MLKIIEKTKLWFSLSISIMLIGLVFLIVNNGLSMGTDFTGGTTITINMEKSFDKIEVEKVAVKHANDAVVRTVDETKVEITSNVLNNDLPKQKELFTDIKNTFKLTAASPESTTSIGSTIGKETQVNGLEALAVATLLMLLYIRIRFKDVRFGIAAIIALIHDVLITLAVYAIFRVPVNSPFIAAMLTIIGYSINDTIVIFDRFRENAKLHRGMSTIDMANLSVTQTMTRSINTVMTVLVTIVAVYFFVPPVKDFAFPLIIGILSGAYSSVFIASPIYVLLKERKKKKDAVAA